MFYDKFMALCAEKGVKPQRACIDMGMSRSLAAKWKATATEKPSAEALEKMSAYFGKSIDELLGKEKAPAPQDERTISDEELMAAFFNGGAENLTKEEMAEMWEDARTYIQYKLEQKRRKNNV